jgi:hypothetical protein
MGYAEMWKTIKPYFDRARETGLATEYATRGLIVERRGMKEE